MNSPWWTSLTPTEVTARGRRRTVRSVVSATIALALSTAAVTVALAGPRTADTTTSTWGTTTRPTIEAVVAGCGPLARVTNPGSQIAWIERADGADLPLPYETTIPAAGWFYRDAPAEDDTSPAPEAVLREMWSGGRVAWYSANSSEAVVASLREMAAEHPEWRMRVAQWPEDRELMPGSEDGSARIAFATWGATQTCSQPRQALAEAVWAAGTEAPGVDGAEPVEFGR